LDSARLHLKNVNQLNHFLEIDPQYQVYLYANTPYGNIDSVETSLNKLIKFYEAGIADNDKGIIIETSNIYNSPHSTY